MNDLIGNIFKLKSSKSYIDYNRYHMNNIFGITKISRLERMHSDFIAWLFDSKSSHFLGLFPLLQFIKSFSLLKKKQDNEQARLDIGLIEKFYSGGFVVGAEVERERDNIDIQIQVATKERVLPVIIENKVNSREHGHQGNQTEVYFESMENKFADKSKYYDPIYIFLYPPYNSNVMQRERAFLRMTYQELVDYVIEPSMNMCGNADVVNNFRIYLQCLSFQKDNERGGYSMAISSEEKKILEEFKRENSDLLSCILEQSALDGDADEDDVSVMISSLRDYSKYRFEGEEYSKSRLVLAVVKKYVADHPSVSFDGLENVFPYQIQGTRSRGVVRREQDIPHTDGDDWRRRYFADEPIVLSESNVRVFVSNQWCGESAKDGPMYGNIERFIKKARELGYVIEKVGDR